MNSNLFFSFPDTEEEFWKEAFRDVELAIGETLKNQKTCRIGLAGGETPKKLYEAMAENDLPWDRIQLIQVDERFVPSDHPDSNAGMLRRTLLRKAPLPPENVILFDTSVDLNEAAEEMNRKLSILARTRQPLLDLLILGAGADGHIASLFEGTRHNTEDVAWALPVLARGAAITERLSLSLDALCTVPRALLLLKGEGKSAVIEALRGERSEPQLTALKTLALTATVKVLAYTK